MRTINVQQGSREWLALRAQHHTASEAPAMMGASKYQQRDQLLHQKHTGITQEIDGRMQALFDRGHATEAAARALLEQELGDDLCPVTALDDTGCLLASFDGITLLDNTGFEHKLWSERLAGQVRAGDLEPHYYWQLEQQILVGGLEKVIFVTSDGTRENWAQMTYCPVPGRAEQLLAGWAQFDADLAAYTAPESKTVPVVGKAPEHLPALRIEVTGAVTASNLAEFRATAMAAIKGVNRELATDADFADAEASVKWCTDVENRLDAAKQHALSQTTDIDTLFRTMDDIAAEARRVRLELGGLVKARKEEIRGEIVAGGVAALREHIACLNAAMPANYVPQVAADFGGAVKGKRTLDSLRGAVNDELARAKIAANEVATRIQCNLKTLHDAPGVSLALFPDVATIVLKACDDFAALVKSRIAEHQAAEQARLDAEREQIRAEEQAKAQREAEAAAAQRERERQEELRQKLEQAESEAQAGIAEARAAEALPAPLLDDLSSLATDLKNEAVSSIDAAQAINTAQRTAAATQPTDAGAANLLIGGINRRLGYEVNAAFLKQLGFEPARVDGARRFYRDSDLPLIGRAIAQHTLRVTQLQTA